MLSSTLNVDYTPEALDALSPELRQSIHLSHDSGFSSEQVADLLGVTVEVVEERLRQGAIALADFRYGS